MEKEIDLSFICKYLRTFDKRAYEIKIIEFYRMENQVSTGGAQFITFMESLDIDYEINHIYKILDLILRELENKFYKEFGFNIRNVELVKMGTITNHKVTAFYNVS